MNLSTFLKEHGLTIECNGFGEWELLQKNIKSISPMFLTKDDLKMWITQNTSIIFYKLYTEE